MIAIHYFDDIKQGDQIEIRLGRLKKDGTGKYRQKGVDTLIAIDMLTKAYSDHYDIAILFAGDEDFTDVISAVKILENGSMVHSFANHASVGLESFDKRLSVDKDWMSKIKSQVSL